LVKLTLLSNLLISLCEAQKKSKKIIKSICELEHFLSIIKFVTFKDTGVRRKIAIDQLFCDL
jgi:hypothetical protein